MRLRSLIPAIVLGLLLTTACSGPFQNTGPEANHASNAVYQSMNLTLPNGDRITVKFLAVGGYRTASAGEAVPVGRREFRIERAKLSFQKNHADVRLFADLARIEYGYTSTSTAKVMGSHTARSVPITFLSYNQKSPWVSECKTPTCALRVHFVIEGRPQPNKRGHMTGWGLVRTITIPRAPVDGWS